MDKEPVAIVATLTAVISAIIALLVAFGVDVSDDQKAAILAVIAAVAPLVTIVARQYVTPVEKANDRIEEAFYAEPTIGKPPLIR